MRRAQSALLIAFCAAFCAAAVLGCADVSDFDGSPRKIYVILGFHSNFYHSWRGDTPDEAGFGTDIRLARAILRMLDEANEKGLDAKGYWETDNHFTLETILPEHAPDIIEGIRRRVQEGQDEVLLAPYNNGLFGAMTEDELRASVRWSITNPWGSGAKDLFGTFTPLIRPNEAMSTTGIAPILREEGVEGVVLAYSSWAFTAFSNFVPTLPPEQRFNPTWVRFGEGAEPLVLFPSVSIGDVLNQVSLERWMLDLRKLQVEGSVDRDLVIHFNFDTDVATWLPVDLPPGLGWFPNSGGLPEYIAAVNKYDWAEFTTPGRYLAEHEPVGEVVLRRDTADGAYDGHASWAEKLPSHAIWTKLDASRLATLRADALARGAPEESVRRAEQKLRGGRDASFFQRLRGLSTTHFGMSTPLVNEERQAVAEGIVGGALDRALAAERLLAETVEASPPEAALHAFHVRDLREPGPGPAARNLLRIPLILDAPVPPMRMLDAAGLPVAFSLVDHEGLPSGRVSAVLLVPLVLRPGESRDVALVPAPDWPAPPAEAPESLANERLRVELDETGGVTSLRVDGVELAGEGFLAPFLTYRTESSAKEYPAAGWRRLPLDGERHDGLVRARLQTRIPFRTPDGAATADLRVDFTLPDGAPWLVADVTVDYPRTDKRDLRSNMQQKLRRYLDLRWIEVAPFPLRPRLDGSRQDPLRVWKHNWLGVTSSFLLDYARVNPKNAELDAFNHQVTAGWVAVSDGSRGLLVGQSSDVRTGYAFVPMRLRERDGRQQLQLNPFGTYHGRQLDYSHMGGTGIGTEFTNVGSNALRPNGPSYNGEREHFALLLAPYAGDEPPAALQVDAEAFYRPPAVVYTRTLAPGVAVRADIIERVAAGRLERAREKEGPLPELRAVLVNPSEAAVDVVWDEPGDARIESYELEWRRADEAAWRSVPVPAPARRFRLDGLEDGRLHAFRLRAVGPGEPGPWTPPQEVAPGAVAEQDMVGEALGASLWLMVRTFGWGLVHVLTTP
jgi:hypothetical protein